MSDPITRLNAALEGRYRIERQLGEGGMATVYLANDLRHERKVALKVLKPELAAVVGADRFLAEIKTTANLQHPHILPLFDSGEADSFLFYVMPYVEGESLRERLDREHQLPVEEAVRIAANVAEALEYAHSQGVIHRDIKPANILLQAGKPVVSDFGIALAVGVAGGGRLTETGLSLGTPHYMSPEQATGDLSVGPAADIYALGCVLYEMLVGEPPFTGSTPQAVLGKIVTGEAPSANAERKSVPPNIDAAIRKALEKVPADRFGSTKDLVRALGDVGFQYGATGAVESGQSEGHWKRIAIGAVAVAAAVSAVGLGVAAGSNRGTPTASRVVTTITAPPGADINANFGLAISPDERTIVFHDFASSRLFRRDLGEANSLAIPGTESSWRPFFSPDGEWIAFFDDTENTLEKVRLDGSGLQTLVSVPPSSRSGGWTADGRLVYNSSGLGGLSEITEAGGEGRPLTRETGSLRWIQLLPGGRAALGGSSVDGVWNVVAVDLERDEMTVLFPGVTPRYLSSGELVYGLGGSIWAVPFDAERLEATGQPVQVAQGVQSSGDRAQYEVTENLLVYQPGTFGLSELPMWVDREGNWEPLIADVGVYDSPKVSPDGGWVALAEEAAGNSDIVIVEVAARSKRRLTFDAAREVSPIWTPDGERVVFASDRDGALNLYWRRADGSDDVERLTISDTDQVPYGWTNDGEVVFTEGGDVWSVAMEVGARPTPILVDSTTVVDYPTVSPDGRFVAVQSMELGYPEIFVHRIPDSAGQWMISTLDIAPFSGISNADVRDGRSPLWSPVASEVLYLSGLFLVRVPLGLGAGIEPGSPEVLLEAGLGVAPTGGRHYDIDPTTGRILVIESVERPNELTVVQNWRAVLVEGRPN